MICAWSAEGARRLPGLGLALFVGCELVVHHVCFGRLTFASVLKPARVVDSFVDCLSSRLERTQTKVATGLSELATTLRYGFRDYPESNGMR